MDVETDHFVKGRLDSPLAPATGSPAAVVMRGSADPAGRTRADEAVLRTSFGTPLPGAADLVAANAGDHVPIHALLRAANQGPSYLDFISWLDEPSYAPADRLLVKEKGQILAHVQVCRRAAIFAGRKLRCGSVQDLAVLPECLPLAYDQGLVAAAERAMRDHQAVISIVRTERPEPFLAAGWSDVQGCGYSRANVGDLLAHLAASRSIAGYRRRGQIAVRLWRHVEMDAVRAVYRAAADAFWGALDRPEAYWQWLVGRKAHSDLIVAVEGPDAWDDLDHQSRIVGYAVTHGPQVLEVCCLKEFSRAAPLLLERACQDAIERDHRTLSLHTSVDDPLHELIITAGGTWSSGDRDAGGDLLVKLLDAPRWIEAMYLLLRARAQAAGIARPCEIGFDVGGGRCRLLITRRSSRLETEGAVATDVRCTPEVFSDLLVGNLHVDHALDDGRLEATPASRRVLSALFPPRHFWQSQFDMLRL